MRTPIASLHHVSPSGAVSLVAANLPFSSLLWTRRASTVGEFSLSLACPMPVAWPGRYLLTLSDHDEVGVVEKAEGDWDGSSGSGVVLSGRFAECLWDRYQLGAGGEERAGASWRQAVTAALSAWHMPDLPPLSMGDGTQQATGSSYALSGDAGTSAMKAIYSCCSANGARPVVGYDRDADPTHLLVRIVDGVDRTRDGGATSWYTFSLALATADGVSYSGDYSVACSAVLAHAERDHGDDGAVEVTRTVPVPGFDAEAQWQSRAYEDVSSLIGTDADPTDALVDQGGALRAYDHMPALAVDCTAVESDYRSRWDLGDVVEVEVAELSLLAASRVEEVRESYDGRGARLEATTGTKTIRPVDRALMGRR